jgi:peptidoglycan/xylan/chitin deacetylase (PgdA/CDA1 family)
MKKLFLALLHAIGVTRLIAWYFRRRTVFLCYHSVTRWPQPVPHAAKLHLPVSLFLSHLDYLQRHYRIIPLGEYLAARREGRQLPDYSLVLTFDDGTRNFLTVVAPLLAERQIPATSFIITGYAAERKNSLLSGEWTPADDHLYLSWAEVRRLMSQPGIEIGSHSQRHPDLTAVTIEEARRDLGESLAAVAEHTGNASPALAYPHGRTNREVRDLAASLGYSCAITGDLGVNTMEANLYALRRVVIADDDDLATFAARVSGVTWMYARLRALLRRVPPDEHSRNSAGRTAGSHPQETMGLVQMKKTSSETSP